MSPETETPTQILNRFTEAQNAEFAAMTIRQKCVQIAKDVLTQLELGRIRARRGVYLEKLLVSIPEAEESPLQITRDDMDKELAQVFGQVTSCEACALGSIFVCAVERMDELKVREAVYFNGPNVHPDRRLYSISGRQSLMHDYLHDYFDWEELEDIEDAFEGVRFSTEMATPKMARIMRNIVRNDGGFNRWDPIDKGFGATPLEEDGDDR